MPKSLDFQISLLHQIAPLLVFGAHEDTERLRRARRDVGPQLGDALDDVGRLQGTPDVLTEQLDPVRRPG